MVCLDFVKDSINCPSVAISNNLASFVIVNIRFVYTNAPLRQIHCASKKSLLLNNFSQERFFEAGYRQTGRKETVEVVESDPQMFCSSLLTKCDENNVKTRSQEN